MGIDIRVMTQQDKPGVMQILHNTPEFKPVEVIVAEELIDAYLGDPRESGYYILVAELNSVVTGYLCFGPTPLTEGTWDIYWIAVAQDKQRRGTGSSLLEAAERNIMKAKGRLAIIETSSTPEYQKARDFYERHGYKQIVSVADFYTIGDDKIIFEKRLK